LLCPLWQVLAVAEEDLVVAATLVVVADVSVALLVAALVRRQLSTEEAFEEHRLSRVHTLPAEVLADQVPHLDSIMVVITGLPCRRADSLAQSIGPQARMSAESLRQIGNQTA
jgi:hypothetical protein